MTIAELEERRTELKLQKSLLFVLGEYNGWRAKHGKEIIKLDVPKDMVHTGLAMRDTIREKETKLGR